MNRDIYMLSVQYFLKLTQLMDQRNYILKSSTLSSITIPELAVDSSCDGDHPFVTISLFLVAHGVTHLDTYKMNTLLLICLTNEYCSR